MAGLVSPLERPNATILDPADLSSRAATAACWREMLSVLLLVALADATIYRSAGFAGSAAFLGCAPLLLLIGSSHRRLKLGFWVISVMLLLLAARMVWLGSGLGVLVGTFLIIAYALTVQGRRPYVFDVVLGGFGLLVAGSSGLANYARFLSRYNRAFPRDLSLNFVLPASALVIFGTLFVLANPDVVTLVAQQIERLSQWLAEFADRISQQWTEALFWIVAAYLAAGLLQPAVGRCVITEPAKPASDDETPRKPQDSPLFSALRNMLVAVIALFAIYLVFEFKTLWFRKFPVGFYYAGYAHEGAAWLTAALALATLVLSLIFRGQVLRDPRIGSLRRLAWIWSAENLVLALTVYNRMYIYIDFNGMTRMRMVGLFGISTVVIGFALVICKIVRGHGFLWLIHRQLWALGVAIYLFVLTPIDTIVHQYNVQQILAGDLAPAVQISVHPISAEGYLVLRPLVDADDSIIRDGLRAMLAEREIELEQEIQRRARLGWTTFQIADRLLLEQLHAGHAQWADFYDAARREAALARFQKYAYQWY